MRTTTDDLDVACSACGNRLRIPRAAAGPSGFSIRCPTCSGPLVALLPEAFHPIDGEPPPKVHPPGVLPPRRHADPTDAPDPWASIPTRSHPPPPRRPPLPAIPVRTEPPPRMTRTSPPPRSITESSLPRRNGFTVATHPGATNRTGATGSSRRRHHAPTPAPAAMSMSYGAPWSPYPFTAPPLTATPVGMRAYPVAEPPNAVILERGTVFGMIVLGAALCLIAFLLGAGSQHVLPTYSPRTLQVLPPQPPPLPTLRVRPLSEKPSSSGFTVEKRRPDDARALAPSDP